jgi:hypothetical protein
VLSCGRLNNSMEIFISVFVLGEKDNDKNLCR